ncbi:MULTISPECIES: methyltransferase [Streptomyces]|uniref:methyltransferase n=1 Tax=Streptomyces TaxID=1883 RepID=UPI0024181F71|nr:MULTISPECIES: methyltransferase [Streptomyces]
MPRRAVPARRRLRLSDPAGRSQQPGLNGVPTGGDLYVLKNILHDWPDEDCLRILTVYPVVLRVPGLWR